MKLKREEKLRAVALREKGYSLNEIVEAVGVAKSSVSEWVRNIPLTEKGRQRLLTKIKLGQLVSAENKRKKTQELLADYYRKAAEEHEHIKFDKNLKRLLCALLYWCEGAKDPSRGINFVNSDPSVIRSFLRLFRESFEMREKKFRIALHLHEYHKPRTQLRFWSKITNVPVEQFIRPYLKPNTGKRFRKNYPGCVSVRYHNADIARQLLTTAKAFLDK